MLISADTSFLRASYGSDAHTSRAHEILAELDAPIILSELGVFEFENSLRLTRWRNLISPEVEAQRMAAFNSDVEAGRVQVRTGPGTFPMARARALSREHTGTTGNRAFDVLLVATALVLGADIFLTFDDRQRALAAAEGLRTEI